MGPNHSHPEKVDFVDVCTSFPRQGGPPKKVPLEIRLKSTRPSPGRFGSRPLPREAKHKFLLAGLSIWPIGSLTAHRPPKGATASPLYFFSHAVYSSPSLIPCVVYHLRDDTGSAASCFRRLVLLYLHCGVVVVSPRRRCLRGFRPRWRGAKHARRRGGCRLAAMCVVVAVVSNILVHNNGAAFGFR